MGQHAKSSLDHWQSNYNKISVNFSTLTQSISQDRFLSLLKLMQNLEIKSSCSQKIWFFKIADSFKADGLRMYSLPFKAFIKSIRNRGMAKMPDPKKFLVGVNFFNQKNRSNEKIDLAFRNKFRGKLFNLIILCGLFKLILKINLYSNVQIFYLN